ncbi:hypothetical protein LJC34_03065 [Oscillospiraceae bacterium OttesenSCG-928-G22]|nr:hypothetical protein [Oscillospiraceae bacterium OttesenSCG-928-G22]
MGNFAARKAGSRTLSKTAYPGRVWLMRPFKNLLICTGIAAGLLFFTGSMIENFLPGSVVWNAGVVCAVAFSAYFIIATVTTRRQEAFAQNHKDRRKAKMREFEAMGFRPTRKFIGSSRIFAVDENQGTWYLIDFFNQPERARLMKLSSIQSAAKGQNGDWVPDGHVIRLFNGKRLNKKDSDNYYAAFGVVLTLDDAQLPTMFINCFKTENDADLILRYLEPLIKRNANA